MKTLLPAPKYYFFITRQIIKDARSYNLIWFFTIIKQNLKQLSMLAVHHYNEFLEATHSRRFIFLLVLEGPGQDRMALLL